MGSFELKLSEKSAGCDFSLDDFDPADFECYGWGWSMQLTVKGWRMELTKK